MGVLIVLGFMGFLAGFVIVILLRINTDQRRRSAQRLQDLKDYIRELESELIKKKSHEEWLLMQKQFFNNSDTAKQLPKRHGDCQCGTSD